MHLGNGEELDGESLLQPKSFNSSFIPLVYANRSTPSTYCARGTLKAASVKGKVMLCMRDWTIPSVLQGEVVKNASGTAMILMNQIQDGFSTFAEAHVCPASDVSYAVGLKIKSYINSSLKSTATILFKGIVIEKYQLPWLLHFLREACV